MFKIIIILFVSGIQCEDRKIYRRKYDAFLKKIEDEFPGYNGRPMPPEIMEMVQNHKKVNDEVEECMFDFSECMAVKKTYPFCGFRETTDEATNLTINVTRWFKNICEFAYRLCRDGENSWISLTTSECDHLEPEAEDEKDAQLTDHKYELDLFGTSPLDTITSQDSEKNQTAPEQKPPEQNPPEQNPPEQISPDQNPPEQNPTEQNPSEQNPPEQNPPEQNPPEQNSLEQNPAAQNPPEQNTPEQNPPEQNPPEQNPPEQNPPEQNPPEQNPPKSRLLLRRPDLAKELNEKISKLTGSAVNVQITNFTTDISQEKKSELMSLLAKVQQLLV